MKKIAGWLLLVVLFYACTNSNHQTNSTKAKSNKAVPDTIIIGDTLMTANFRQFWKQFQTAVKLVDTAAINKLTLFPIRNVRYIYLPSFKVAESEDSVGLSPIEFRKISAEMFDSETSELTTTPADSLYLYTPDVNYRLPIVNMVDKHTPIFIYPVEYAQKRTGGTKSLYFGRIKGIYKLIWIECLGHVEGHKRTRSKQKN